MLLAVTLVEYRQELLKDFRTFYHTSINEIGYSIGYEEALGMITALAYRSESWYACKRNKWDYPMSRLEIMIADLFDVMLAANSKKKPKPYPRPFKNGNSRTFAGTPMSRTEANKAYGNLRKNISKVTGKEESLWQAQVESQKPTFN